jgi:hypothetical protein
VDWSRGTASMMLKIYTDVEELTEVYERIDRLYRMDVEPIGEQDEELNELPLAK